MDTKKLFSILVEPLKPILDEIKNNGGVSYLVGGSVRDAVLGLPIKDLDIEVHKISLEKLQEALEKFGGVSLVGKQFGVLKLHRVDADWSLPRRDSEGRKPEVILDADLDIKEACRRRDLSMNAMAVDLHDPDLKILDFYGGLEDVKEKRLRFVDEKLFEQDPLRFYRVMQFVGRFEMEPDEQLNRVCKKMDLVTVLEGGELARERIYEEIKKMLLKSKRPSLGFRWVEKIGRLNELFPELGALVRIDQRSDYHPEGNVFEHTMQTIDVLATKSDVGEEKFMIMLALLCHDMGKAKATDAKLSTKGHDSQGVPIAKTFLKRFTWEDKLIRSVCKLVRYHMAPLTFVQQKSGIKAYKRLAVKLAPEVTPYHLYLVAWTDVRGRKAQDSRPNDKGNFSEDDLANILLKTVVEEFWKKAREAKVETGPEEPVLKGRDLIGLVEPGPKMGEILRKAYQIQIDEGIADLEELKRLVLK